MEAKPERYTILRFGRGVNPVCPASFLNQEQSNSRLEKAGRVPEKEKDGREGDSLSSKKKGVARAKQLFDDLEFELFDLDAGRHVVVRGKNRIHYYSLDLNRVRRT